MFEPLQDIGKFRSIPSKTHVTIVSYELATKLEQQYCSRHKFWILDESHKCKDHKTLRTKFLRPIVQKAEHAVLISGTPTQGKPIELFTQATL